MKKHINLSAFFQVGPLIGQGSFATVHKARDVSSRRDVALKIVRPESEINICPEPNSSPEVAYDDVLNAMKHEIAHIEKVGLHPNIIRIFGTAEDCRVFVMERAAVDLYNLIKNKPQLPLVVVQRWSCGLLEAVSHIHRMGVVHQVSFYDNVITYAMI
jgi:serine/threonine protein kinase